VSMKESSLVNLEELLNTKVTVQVKGRRKLRGTLTKYDDYMNLLLENVEELEGEEVTARHKVILVKGGNIQSITA
jgi:small nuclear ribonucleoprotein (snRNP)-like protein